MNNQAFLVNNIVMAFRSMRGAESKEVCPQIQLVQVPVARGKADLSTYRNAGSEVSVVSETLMSLSFLFIIITVGLTVNFLKYVGGFYFVKEGSM